MSEAAVDTYLNDHLGGATLGSDLAGQIRDRNQGTPLGEVMADLAREVEEDRETLLELTQRMGTSKNPVKQVTGWVAEKASRVKFSGLTSEPEFGTFMALESMRLGVIGKGCLWKALAEVADQHPPLATVDLAELIARAERQQATLERERLAAARRALAAQTVR